MKNLLFALIFTAILSPLAALAQNDVQIITPGNPSTMIVNPCSEAEGEYCLLEPLPMGADGEFSKINSGTGLSSYLQTFFKILLGIITVLAVVMIIVGGVQYMTTDAIGGKENGKETVTNALGGLILALGSWLILNTINPDLVSFKLNIKDVEVEGVVFENPEDAIEQGGSATSGTKLCSSTATCEQVCATYCTNGGKSCDYTQGGQPTSMEIQNIPSVSPKAANVRITTTVAPGLNNFKPSVDSLISTNQIPSGNYTLVVSSGYRSITRQLELACPNLDKVPSQVAYPGASPHGSGVAVDVALYKNGSKLNICNVENSQLLDQIMTNAGFSRYTKEAWHYEYGVPASSTALRCQYPNCPTATYCQGL